FSLGTFFFHPATAGCYSNSIPSGLIGHHLFLSTIFLVFTTPNPPGLSDLYSSLKTLPQRDPDGIRVELHNATIRKIDI
ncbi:MAG: hypothetical protein KAU06_06720, partial [Candidatus Marinimicrobia bacterium]|nr:hypothetical protein [Candidatus Neomarinimicrobiota bacterium]